MDNMHSKQPHATPVQSAARQKQLPYGRIALAVAVVVIILGMRIWHKSHSIFGSAQSSAMTCSEYQQASYNDKIQALTDNYKNQRGSTDGLDLAEEQSSVSDQCQEHPANNLSEIVE